MRTTIQLRGLRQRTSYRHAAIAIRDPPPSNHTRTCNKLPDVYM